MLHQEPFQPQAHSPYHCTWQTEHLSSFCVANLFFNSIYILLVCLILCPVLVVMFLHGLPSMSSGLPLCSCLSGVCKYSYAVWLLLSSLTFSDSCLNSIGLGCHLPWALSRNNSYIGVKCICQVLLMNNIHPTASESTQLLCLLSAFGHFQWYLNTKCHLKKKRLKKAPSYKLFYLLPSAHWPEKPFA